ncbi:L-aspartate oxidase [Desulfobulbus sp.]|uniref:L-aspartate oxidase n=1 Tax=Desulfobulbus sp. TaxID=895 RepID=UPI00286F1B1F|nr:L-aspartate oxidase [Desulfobulbus sp.]
MSIETDFLVIGSGIAGLSYALRAADHGRVLIVTKGDITECNTNYAQGGIACVMYEPDTFERHIHDTLVCGSGICDRRAVEQVVTGAPAAIKELVRMGTKFDRSADGTYELAREGGHTENRILHAKDLTGAELERVLVRQVKRHPNIEVREHHFAVDILTQHHLGQMVRKNTSGITCYGAYVLDLKTQQVATVLSRVTVLATGGVGNIDHTTTNPSVATGDGIAMVHRAKGVIDNMAFIQFHPTSLYHPGERPAFLISEAMRGFGAKLRLPSGEEFMSKYHPMGSLAPRDVVARGIDNEMKTRGLDYVYLDVTHLDPRSVIDHFPNIYKKCLSEDIDITKDVIPVAPAAHYCCGGVKVDLNGQTSIRHLYALGETSSTGLHGANRLASNSLIEAAVYASKAAAHSIQKIKEIELRTDIPAWDYEGTSHPEEMILITQNYREMQQIMSAYVGIVRSNLRLDRANRRLEIIFRETEELYLRSTLSRNLCELRNMIAVGYLIIKDARRRTESIGLHYSLDYPASPGNEF